MKKGLSILGGILGGIVGVGLYILLMELVFESDRLSTKLGGVCLIGGALAGSSLMDFLTGKNKAAKPEANAGSGEASAARVQRFWNAIERGDHEALEGMRDQIQPGDVAPLAARWSQGDPWSKKEALIGLVMDRTAQKHPPLEPIFRDGLEAPSFEVRCYAYCSLTGDFDAFTELLNGGDDVLKRKLAAQGLG